MIEFLGEHYWWIFAPVLLGAICLALRPTQADRRLDAPSGSREETEGSGK